MVTVQCGGLTMPLSSTTRSSPSFPLNRGNLQKSRHLKTKIKCCYQTHYSKREVLFRFVGILSSFPCIAGLANAVETVEKDGYKLYQDDKEKFSLLLPQELRSRDSLAQESGQKYGWIKGEGSADEQRVTAFSPENETTPNLSVVITGAGADYTKMESFGSVDAFAETLVNSLDRSWQRPPGQEAKLLDAKSKRGLYFVEYSLQKPGEKKIHFFSAVGIGLDVWYNKLYTLTGQYVEEDADKYKSMVEKSVLSFRIA